MQIVIDIPEEDYIRLKEQRMFGRVDVLKNAVSDAVVLPKGHGRLIDEDELLLKLKCWDTKANGIPNYVFRSIKLTSAVIEADKDVDS